MNALLELSRMGNESAIAICQRADRIKLEVGTQMFRTQYSALRGVTCEYQHGILQLLGRVRSYYLKQLAQELARRVEGVTHVINSIHIIDESNPSEQETK